MFFADGRVAPVPPPQTNAERQRDFQRAHPGYDRRRKARERAATKREAALLMAQLQAAEAAKAETVEVLRIPIPTTRYALPAPVECLAMAAINELPKLLAANRQRVMQPASHHDGR
jgi:hypothetical protein